MSYKVFVANVGVVYEGESSACAKSTFVEHSIKSDSAEPPDDGNDVVLYANGEVVQHFIGYKSRAPRPKRPKLRRSRHFLD